MIFSYIYKFKSKPFAMKNRKQGTIVAFFILILLIPNGCKKDKEEEIPASPSGPVVPETTKVISQDDWNTSIVNIDSTNWTLTVQPVLVEQYDLNPGDIIISTDGEGLLRKINKIDDASGNKVITTGEGTIVEAIPAGS